MTCAREHIWEKFFTRVRLPQNEYSLIEFFLREGTQYADDFFHWIHHLGEDIKHTRSHEKSTRYLHILSPLCERLGFFELKEALDSEAFQVVDEKAYNEIKTYIDENIPLSLEQAQKIQKKFQTIGNPEKNKVVSFRKKHPYSVYKKVEGDWAKIGKLRDLMGFRVVIEGTEEDAFDYLTELHKIYTPLLEGFKDYISIPKINGYQSLHTTILFPLEKRMIPIEIQIRTKHMDTISEYGIYAHFLHKVISRERRFVEVRTIMKNFTKKEGEPLVYILTHKGDIRTFTGNITGKVFARSIHSHFLQNSTKMKINGEEHDIGEKLADGDEIEILTSQHHGTTSGQ